MPYSVESDLVAVIGTERKQKPAALKTVLSRFGIDRAQIISVSASSEVSRYPMSDDEMISGAYNRALGALRGYASTSDWLPNFAVGLESGVQQTYHGLFMKVSAVVVDPEDEDRYWPGQSGAIRLDKDIANTLLRGEDVDKFVDGLYPQRLDRVRRKLGMSGILSGGLCTRRFENETALMYALGIYARETDKLPILEA